MNVHLLDLRGVHVLKKIDGLHQPNDMRYGNHVYLHLEHVARSGDELKAIAPDCAAGVLGCAASTGPRSPCIRRSVPLGELHLFEVGQIFVDGRLVGSLPRERRDVRCDQPQETGARAARGVLELPAAWSNNSVLTHKELHLGYSDDSHYLIFRYQSVEYVLPLSVVFKTFYCPSSAFANKLTGSTWGDVVDHFVESGRELVEGDRRVWELKLRFPSSGTKALLHQLALFMFDPHAKRCANLIHSLQLQHPSDPYSIRAQIPHSTTDLPMTVLGYPLFQYKKWGRIERFLITSLVKCRWTAGDVIIRQLIDEPDPNAPEAEHSAGNSGFPTGQRLQADDTTTVASPSIPDPNSDTVTISSKPMEYEDAPTMDTKVTLGAATIGGGGQGRPEKQKDDQLVSGGIPGPGEERVSKAEIAQPHRTAYQLRGSLGDALLRLQTADELKVACAGPLMSSPLHTLRAGLHAFSGAGPKTGRDHAVSKLQMKDCSWAWMPEPDDRTIKYARALFAYGVYVGDWGCVLLEVERRKGTSEAFRFFIVENASTLADSEIEPFLETLRAGKGVVADLNCASRGFQGSIKKLHSFQHRRRTGEETEESVKTNKLDDEYLLNKLNFLKSASKLRLR